MAADFFKELERTRWQTAFKTFGSSHATLIGILVDWWVSGNQEGRYALEGGPGLGFKRKTVGAGGVVFDALFVEGDTPRAIVEVDGGGVIRRRCRHV